MTVGIQASSDGTYGSLLVGGSDSLRFGSDSSGQLTGFRNKLINGNFKIDYRNNGSPQTITAAAALAYTVDRWYAYCTGANVTVQQITVSGEDRFRFTGLASNTLVGMGQRIEDVNCMDLAGKTATLSCKLSSTSLTSVTWVAYYANTANTFGTLASPTKTQIATGTFTINSTETTYSTNITVPSVAYTGIEIVLLGGALLGSQTLTIGDVQLEKGSIASEYEVRPDSIEDLLCQRYQPAIVMSAGSGLGAGVAYSAVVGLCTVPFRVAARVAPTGISASAGNLITFYFGGYNSATTAIAYNGAGQTGGSLSCTISGATTGQGCIALGNANPGKILFTGAEL